MDLVRGRAPTLELSERLECSPLRLDAPEEAGHHLAGLRGGGEVRAQSLRHEGRGVGAKLHRASA
eukprot:6691792-Alexandrium_andersonii.AAC.1